MTTAASATDLEEVARQVQNFLDNYLSGTPTLADDIALPAEVAKALNTSEPGLAQMRYRGTGPRFRKVGRKVVYLWSDIRAYLDENACQRTDGPRGAGVR